MMIRKILVGIDFSEQTDAVLAQAGRLARQHGAEVVLAHVLYPGFESPLGHLGARYSDALGLHQDKVRADLFTLRSRLDPALEVTELLLEGHPAPTLAIAADELDADLVVIGSHGRASLKRLLLGSVAERTVRFADRSVLVVKDPPPDGRFRSILVPTDFSAAAEQALVTSFEIAAPDARIELLHCWSTPVYMGSLDASSMGMVVLSPEIGREVRAQGMRLVETYRDHHPALRFHEVESKATYGILDRIESERVDLVVMGSHGRSGLGRWLLGSVAEHTVRHAPCSVLVIKAPGVEDDE